MMSWYRFTELYDNIFDHAAKSPEVVGEDIDLCWRLLSQVLEQQGHARVLDPFCGTGRVIDGLMQHMAAHPDWHVSFIGVDMTVEMLEAALRKFPPETLPLNVTCSWVQADATDLSSSKELRDTPFDLILIPAGSFHHLQRRAEQHGCLAGVQRLLADHPAARAVVSLVPKAFLPRITGQVLQAGAYRRSCMDNERVVLPDGGAIWRRQFLLEKLPASGSGDVASEPTWQHLGSCVMREVEPKEFREMAEMCGLAVAQQGANYIEAAREGKDDEDGLVFVLRQARVA